MGGSEAELVAVTALTLLSGATAARAGACLRELAAAGCDRTPEALVPAIAARLGLPPEEAVQARRRARAAVARAAQASLTGIPFGTPAYPPLLREIFDPPPVLWVAGEPAALLRPAVAVVGARAASPGSLLVARQLGADLAAREVVVVSGLARGVDSAAHQGALDAGGITVAVLGSGADRIYPPEHAALARDVARRGAVVSELPPGTPPRRHQFPQRNRIISGLVRGVVVVEAGDRSGSLVTARCALEQGREVMAVPGMVVGGRNRGAHRLLRDGAKLVERVDDILEEFPGLAAELAACPGTAPADPVLAALAPGELAGLDALADATGLDPATLLGRLLELELAGCVRRVIGGRFLRVEAAGGRL